MKNKLPALHGLRIMMCSWIEQISGHLLGIKKHELHDYLSDFLRPDMPLDEIGILMFSRMMHKHCIIFFNDVWWMTCKDNDVYYVGIVL